MKSKLFYVFITIMILAFAGYLVQVAFVGDPLENIPEVRGLRLTQEDMEINANWDSLDCDGYTVVYSVDGKTTLETEVRDNTYTIKGVYPGQFCAVTVYAHLKYRLPSHGATAVLKADKIKRDMTLEETVYYGFAGSDFKVNVATNGEPRYRSTDSSVASVDADGRVTLGEVGEAEIIISAAGNGFYEDTQREVSVIVYPDSLEQIRNVTVENISATKAVIRWQKDEMASAYSVLKKNPATGDYEKIKELPVETNYFEVIRDEYEYAIKGMAVIADTKVQGKTSEPAQVKGTEEEAKVYSKATTIGTLDADSLELVAEFEGPKKIRSPQSMSLIGDHYVVNYVNKKGTKGAFVSCSRDGVLDKSVKTGALGHANGATYNPYTNELYITKYIKKKDLNKCSVYNGETKERIKTINLPENTSGIAFDVTNNKYYLSKANRLYVCDSKFNVEKQMEKSARFIFSQDICGYNSTVLVCTWVKKNKSFIDMYRISDGAYIGSYLVPVGELESCVIDDGYLVILINKKGLRDRIYRTKKRIAIP